MDWVTFLVGVLIIGILSGVYNELQKIQKSLTEIQMDLKNKTK